MNPNHRPTNALEKLLDSAVNALLAALAAAPVLLLAPSLLQFKLALVGAFLLENLYALAFHGYRLPGMWLLGTRWQRGYPLSRQLTHALLYTASFSTLVFRVWWPGDLLLFNLLCLQLPCVLATGTTLHGWLAGGMVDVRPRR